MKTTPANSGKIRLLLHSGRGFTLVELLIAMAIFLIVSAAAFSLFNQQQVNSMQEQGQVSLNLALRNAASQLQIDAANAGSGYFQGINIPSWPVGITLVNNVVAAGTSCYNPTTRTYGANCFDRLNIIVAADPTVYPAVHATDSTGAAGTGNCSDTSTGAAYTQAAAGLTLAQTAAKFSIHDQLLLLNASGSKITSVVLTANAAVSGLAVALAFHPTNPDGTNSPAYDPLDITACDGHTPCAPGKFGVQYCGNDWILKLAPISYSVDLSSPNDPQLTRTQSGLTSTVMDQIIGFKVGASILNSASPNPQYIYSACTYAFIAGTYDCSTLGDQAYNFTLVRSIRVSMIGRTAPGTNPAATTLNSFDQGTYQVQGLSIVVNPRNMSMND